MAQFRSVPWWLAAAPILLLSGCFSLPVESDPKSAEAPTEQPERPPVPAAPPQQPVVIAAANVTAIGPDAFAAPEEPPAAPPQGVWERLRGRFSLATPDHPRLLQELDWYQSHPDYLARVHERATPYLYYIAEQLDTRALPSELALLPVVESAFQPFAYSPGRAAGIWQFIPSTARHYGLKIDWWYDGRRDIVAATGAALDYLERLGSLYDGDWELALAAYNSGAGTVNRAIRRNQKRGEPTDFWHLELPRETRRYVPRLLALARLIGDPEGHGIGLPYLPNAPHFTRVETGGQIDLALAAELAGITLDELYRLNPAYNRWATDPEGPHQLYLPLAAAERFRDGIAGLPAERRMTWERYRVRPGDTLSEIARHHRTTVSLLQEVNELRGHSIRAGRHLLIPVASQSPDAYRLSATQRREAVQERARQGERVVHRVRSGDTLWDIARTYDVDHRKLARWNAMAPGDTLRLDQRLVIWRSPGGGQAQTGAALPDLERKPQLARSRVSYQVRNGDSLARIAQRFNVSIADLRRWNSLPGKYLQPGQRLELYVDVTEQSL